MPNHSKLETWTMENISDNNSMIGSSVEKFINLTIEEVRARYLMMYPRKTRDDFNKEVILSMNQAPNVSGDDAVGAYFNALDHDIQVRHSTLPLVISVAYCLQADWAIKEGYREKAWSCIAEARYWCGSMLTRDEIELSVDGIIRKSRNEQARNAANIRTNIKYGQVRKRVVELAVDLRPANGWKSRRNASFQIFDFLKTNNELSPLTITQGSTTIDGWLKEMPNSKDFFQHQKY